MRYCYPASPTHDCTYIHSMIISDTDQGACGGKKKVHDAKPRATWTGKDINSEFEPYAMALLFALPDQSNHSSIGYDPL